MPGRDGTGPLGQGQASGRGRGFCAGRASSEAIRGSGRGRGIFCRRNNQAGQLREEASRLEKILSGVKRRLGEDEN